MKQIRKNTSHEQKSRDFSIDFAKGVLIFLVIVGHTHDFQYTNIIYWFHMPAFFFISGFLYTFDKKPYQKTLLRITQQLMPYFAYGIILTIGGYLLRLPSIDQFNWNILEDQLLRLFKGGRIIKGEIGIAWFINVYIVIYLIFYFFIKLNKYIISGILILLYLAVHLLSYSYANNAPQVTWGVDIAMYAIIPFTFGFFSKTYTFIFKRNIIGYTVAAFCLGIIILHSSELFEFNIDLKYFQLNNWYLDLTIPMLFTYCLLFFSYKIQPQNRISKAIIYLGKNSLTIMYLHIFCNTIFFFLIYRTRDNLTFILVGVLFPILILQLIKRSTITRKLFLGTK